MMSPPAISVSGLGSKHAFHKFQHSVGKVAGESEVMGHKLAVSDSDTEDTREPDTEAESLGRGGSPRVTDTEDVRGKAMVLAYILAPPGLALPGSVLPPRGLALPGSVLPPPGLALPGSVLPPTGLAFPGSVLPPPGLALPGSVLPPPGLALPGPFAAPAAGTPKKAKLRPALEPMTIDAQHVKGRRAEVKNPARPIKKRPLWSDPSAKRFDRSAPVYQTVPEILLVGPPPSVLCF